MTVAVFHSVTLAGTTVTSGVEVVMALPSLFVVVCTPWILECVTVLNSEHVFGAAASAAATMFVGMVAIEV